MARPQQPQPQQQSESELKLYEKICSLLLLLNATLEEGKKPVLNPFARDLNSHVSYVFVLGEKSFRINSSSRPGCVIEARIDGCETKVLNEAELRTIATNLILLKKEPYSSKDNASLVASMNLPDAKSEFHEKSLVMLKARAVFYFLSKDAGILKMLEYKNSYPVYSVNEKKGERTFEFKEDSLVETYQTLSGDEATSRELSIQEINQLIANFTNTPPTVDRREKGGAAAREDEQEEELPPPPIPPRRPGPVATSPRSGGAAAQPAHPHQL